MDLDYASQVLIFESLLTSFLGSNRNWLNPKPYTHRTFKFPCYKSLSGNSQKFLQKFVRFFFVTLSLKILRLFRLKVLFEADIIKG